MYIWVKLGEVKIGYFGLDCFLSEKNRNVPIYLIMPEL